MLNLYYPDRLENWKLLQYFASRKWLESLESPRVCARGMKSSEF